jgi:hypothetical protein
MKSSENKENIDELVFHWDQKSSLFSNNIINGKKPSISEYLKFFEDMNSHHYREHKKNVVFKNIFTLT